MQACVLKIARSDMQELVLAKAAAEDTDRAHLSQSCPTQIANAILCTLYGTSQLDAASATL